MPPGEQPTSFASLPLAPDASDDDDDADFVLPQDEHKRQHPDDGFESTSSLSSSSSSSSNTARQTKKAKRRESKGKGSSSQSRRLNEHADADADRSENKDHDQIERERRRRVEALWAEINHTGISQRETSRLRPAQQGSSSSILNDHDPHSATIELATAAGVTSPEPNPTSDTHPVGNVPASAVPPQRQQPPQPRKSKLLALAAKYGLADAAKLSVLEQSKADWKRHVDLEGDRHSLDRARKDGYLEKVDFLNRTDDRQAELHKKLKKARLHRRKG
ncbi:hypothetical protein HDU86_004723 [Geranomyces michiganensis]|nr:hypothetical protein HDU86_004723 [Geranomyces michiganensis]